MKADGSGPIFSTYIGGDYLDSVSALAIDASGDAYVAGQTFGQGPDKALQGTSLGLTQPAAGPAFVMKIDPLGATALFTSLLPYSNVATLALDPTGNVYTAGQPNTANAIAVSKIDPTGQKLLYFSVIPATSPTLLGITVDPSGAAYLTGALADIQIPDSVPSTRLISNAFLLKIDPAPLQCDLSLEAQSNGSLLAGQAASLVLTIHNAGPAEAQNVVLTANTAQGVMLLSCRTSASGVCDPNLQVPSASFSSIPPGGSAAMELELPGGAQVAASVSTASSDLNQNNNSAIATPVSNFVPVSVQSDLATVITINGQPENLIFSVPPNSQVQIYCPSPQISRYGDVIVFESWSDGSTENPRTITATPPGISLTVNFSYLGTPYFTPASIVNAGSYAANGVSPGELISIYGFNLAQNATAELVNGRLPTSLGGTTLSFNGVAAPLIYAGSTQINAIVPYALGGQTTTKITLQNGNGTQSMTVPLIAAVPALFTANTSGNGQAAALNQDGTPNSPANPANPGDVIVLYGTGAGMVSPVPPDGSISSSAAAIPNLPITVTIGGQPATVLYAGSAPGLVAGVIQINARIPVGIQYSHHEAVTWSAGSFASPAGVTIAINDTPGPAYVYQAGPDDLSLSSIVLSPSRIAADSDATVVTISGSGFVSGMVAQWNNQPRATQFVDSATLQVTLTGNDLESAALGSLAVWDASQTHQITQAVPLLVYLPVLNNYLAYDSSRDKIYIAVAQKQMPQGASIAVLNPKTRRFERWYSLPIEPTKLALSADDRYLYVDQGNTVSRIDLTSWQADLEIQLGQDATLGSRQVYTMVTLPDTNTSLAVSFFKTGLSPPYLGTAVFDGAQIRPKVTESHNGPSYLIGGPDDTTLYGGDESGNFYTLNLDSSGATVANTVVGLLGSDGDSVYAGGLIYDSWGAAVDPSESLVVNTWDNQGLIVPLPNLQKVLILGGIPPPDFGQFSPLTVLTLHDLNIGQRLWSLPLPVSPELNHGPMLRWGTDGIVLRESQIYNASAPGIDIFRVNLGQ
jgi:uncharacterized protein (TIGR03437 family)